MEKPWIAGDPFLWCFLQFCGRRSLSLLDVQCFCMHNRDAPDSMSETFWSSLSKLTALLFIAYQCFLMCVSDKGLRSVQRHWSTGSLNYCWRLCVCVCACTCGEHRGWQDTKRLLICLAASSCSTQSFINSLFTFFSFVLSFVCYVAPSLLFLACLW